MKKMKYYAPEMECVQIVEKCSILAGSGETAGGNGSGLPGGFGPGSNDEEETEETSLFD